MVFLSLLTIETDNEVMILQEQGVEQPNAETKNNKVSLSTMFRLKINGTAILCYY